MNDEPDLARLALQQAGDGIIVIDTHGVIQEWNDKCVQIFGWTRDQAVGQDVKMIIPERLRDAHDRAFFAAMGCGHLASDGQARRTRGLTSEGGKVYVTMTFAVIIGPDGAAIGSVAVAREYFPDAAN